MVAWADRIAYVCHDFEDAVRAHILEPADLPAEVRDVVGSERSEQVGTFVLAVLDAVDRTGTVAMTEPAASALAGVPRRSTSSGSTSVPPRSGRPSA